MRVNVRNTNRFGHPLQEKFRGKMIYLKAGETLEMERDEAVLFKGQFKPLVRDKGGSQLPESMKSLVIEPIGMEIEEKPPEYKCQACGFKATSETGLKRHITNKHADELYDVTAEDAHKEIIKGES